MPWVILNQWGYFHSHIQCTISDGKPTSFWFDQWTGNESLKNRFPKLFAISESRFAPISDVWSTENSSWILNTRRNLKDDEINEWISFTQLYPNIHLSQQPNHCRRKLDNSGIFSIKALLIHLSSEGPLLILIFKGNYGDSIAQRE